MSKIIGKTGINIGWTNYGHYKWLKEERDDFALQEYKRLIQSRDRYHKKDELTDKEWTQLQNIIARLRVIFLDFRDDFKKSQKNIEPWLNDGWCVVPKNCCAGKRDTTLRISVKGDDVTKRLSRWRETDFHLERIH